MNLKPREIPVELNLLRLLRARMTLPNDQHYLNLEQGYAGERIMDGWLEGLSIDCLLIDDLLLEQNRHLFQIDSLVIFQETIYILDAKHNAGDFYIDGDKWKTVSGIEIQNPLLQMKRSITLLRKLLQQHRLTMPVDYLLIFTHPEFYLYNDSTDLPAVFPTQMPRFLKKMNGIHSRIGVKQQKIADRLLTLHEHENPYIRLPEYDFERLDKGVICAECRSFMVYDGRRWKCSRCNYAENAEEGIMRNVDAFKLLFPERKITTRVIYEWCGMNSSKRHISRVLANHYERIGQGKRSHYKV